MDIINQILAQPQISDSLVEYTFVDFSDLETIPLGSHVKFIDRNENVKSGGFLIKFSEKPDRTKTYIILKSNLMYKIYPYYYWIFYKKPTHESKIVKTIKNYRLGHLLESTKPTPSTTPNMSQTQDQDQNKVQSQRSESDPNSTIMNIVIKSKPEAKPKGKKAKPEPQVEPDPDPQVSPEAGAEPQDKPKPKSKTKSKPSSKRDVFKALLESLNK